VGTGKILASSLPDVAMGRDDGRFMPRQQIDEAWRTAEIGRMGGASELRDRTVWEAVRVRQVGHPTMDR
jgi:hypothetical protein